MEMNELALLDTFLEICTIVTEDTDQRSKFARLCDLTRQLIIFDHLVIYQNVRNQKPLEVLFARSLGRGRGRENLLPSSEEFALEAYEQHCTRQSSLTDKRTGNNRSHIHILAIPFNSKLDDPHILVLIRNSHLPFQENEVKRAEVVNHQIARLIPQHLN